MFEITRTIHSDTKKPLQFLKLVPGVFRSNTLEQSELIIIMSIFLDGEIREIVVCL